MKKWISREHVFTPRQSIGVFDDTNLSHHPPKYHSWTGTARELRFMVPDLGFGFLETGRRRIMVDVAVVHPGAPSRLRAAQRSLGTALQQQRIKHARYDRLARTEHSIFLPFIVETFGATAPEARSVMREIASFAGRLIPSQTRHATLVRLMTQISVAVQRGNAQAVLACIQDG